VIRTVFRYCHTTYVDHDHFGPPVFTSSFVFYVVFCGSLFVFLSFFVDTLMMEGTSQLFITIFGRYIDDGCNVSCMVPQLFCILCWNRRRSPLLEKF